MKKRLRSACKVRQHIWHIYPNKVNCQHFDQSKAMCGLPPTTIGDPQGHQSQ